MISASVEHLDEPEWYLNEDGTEMSFDDMREVIGEQAVDILAESEETIWDVDVSIVEVD